MFHLLKGGLYPRPAEDPVDGRVLGHGLLCKLDGSLPATIPVGFPQSRGTLKWFYRGYTG